MYKEYRDVSRTLAVQSLYQDMAARHRARFRSIHVHPLPLPLLYITPFFCFSNCRADSLLTFRSSALLKSRRRRMSSVLTSDNCFQRIWNSLFLTVSPRALARRSLQLRDQARGKVRNMNLPGSQLEIKIWHVWVFVDQLRSASSSSHTTSFGCFALGIMEFHSSLAIYGTFRSYKLFFSLSELLPWPKSSLSSTNSAAESGSSTVAARNPRTPFNFCAPHLAVFFQSLNHQSNFPKSWSARFEIGTFGHNALVYQVVKTWQLR